MSARVNEAGYTLLELLIVMGLLSVLSVLLLSGLNLGLRAWETGESSGVTVREIATAQARVRDFIRNAYPAIVATDPANPHVAFEGDETSLSFITIDRAAQTAGRSRVTLAHRAGGFTAATAAELAQAPPAEEALARNAAAVTFAYLAEDGTAWTKTWRNKAKLPRLVRIDVSFVEGDRRRWPALVVAPRIDADVACSFDPLTKSCRGR